MNFLGILLVNNKLKTNIYRKPTWSEKCGNYLFLHTSKIKIAW